MVWYVVPCFRSRDHCPVLTEEARAFFSLLSEDLKMLERSLAEGGSVSLRWSVEAMNLLKKMQIELVALFKRSQLPVSSAAEEEDWFDQFMQETATLLDFCNSLKCALSGINRYRMVTDLMVHKIDVEDGSACSRLSLNDWNEFERLEEEHTRSSVRAMKETVSIGNGSEGSKNSNMTNGSIAAVMLAARATMVSVSLILVSAIVSPILPVDVASEELIWTRFPQLRPFADMLKSLTVRFCERVSKPDEEGSRFVLAEHETVDSAVGDLRAQVMQGLAGDEEREGFLESVGLLRTSSAELREGVEMFDAVVDEVFDVVIRGRKEMLGMFRDEVLSV